MGDVEIGRGASISYPESSEWDADNRMWSLTTRWIDRTEAIGLIEVAIRMLDSILRVGKATTAPPKQRPNRLEELFYPTSFRPEDLVSGGRTGPARRVRMPVIKEQKPPDTSGS